MVRDWIGNRRRGEDLQQQQNELEAELQQLTGFLRAAPRLEEEEKFTIPPPAEFYSALILPKRRDFAQLHRQQVWLGSKLFAWTVVMVLMAVWVLERIQTYTNWLQ